VWQGTFDFAAVLYFFTRYALVAQLIFNITASPEIPQVFFLLFILTVTYSCSQSLFFLILEPGHAIESSIQL